MAETEEHVAYGEVEPTLGNGTAVKEDSSSGNKFQQAIAAWRSFNLSSLVSSLDETASHVVNHQRDSLVQRKELAQKTKEFRKLDDAAKLTEIKDLLKSYQNYVDVLTNHAKSVSAAFMNVYSPLSEAPDPYPLLEASIDSLVTAEEVAPRLERENERLHKQITSKDVQLEELEKQLEKERNKIDSYEESHDRRIKEVGQSWSAVLAEKENNWNSREKALEDKIGLQDQLLQELKASYEVNRRLERSGEEDQEIGRPTATAAELEIANSELERAHTRLVELQSRNEQMRIELAQSTTQSRNTVRSTKLEDEPAFQRLRSENMSLMRKLESSRYTRDSEKSTLEGKVKSSEREIASIRADRDLLLSKLSGWNDYDEIKRELQMLRAIEFATITEDESTEKPVAPNSNGYSKSDSLEQLLMARNKKLSTELTELRVAHNELREGFETLRSDLEIAQKELVESHKLNASLENDLQKIQQEASSAWETVSIAPTYTPKYPKSSYGSKRGTGAASPTSSLISGFDPSGHQSPRVGNSAFDSIRASEGGGQGILPMVTAQRDRFKTKISELEVELQAQYATISSLRSEISSLQKDNLDLYEKTRYVSSYSRTVASTGAAYGANPNPNAITVTGLTDDRYQTAYESNISPFAAFRGRESARAFKRMSLPERALFQVTRMVLQTRTSRNLFAAYCAGLHLLVLGMLYWMSTVDVEKHLTGGAAGDWHREGFDGNNGN